MNEELQRALAEILNGAIEAKDFLLSEMPDVINQLLWWHGVKSGLATLTFVLVWVGVVLLWRKLIKGDGDEDVFLFCAVLTTMWSIVGWMFPSLDWLQILIAPKLYLIEYAAKLVG